MVEVLRERLSSLKPIALDIEDESYRHAGHEGARDGGHYNLRIVAEVFAGKNTVARHRLIYAATDDLMRCGIHALSVIALAPDEV